MISLKWVNDYVDIKDIDLNELALKVTKAGINVEKITTTNIDNLVIGEVLECVPHPDSDHLNICQVDVKDEILQIVCGASNVRKGLKVIVAKVGAKLPDGDGYFVIKKGKIRNQESNGMICALFELGLEEKTEETYNKGITELDEKAPIGENPIKYLELDDTIYTLDLNPNRSDCNNHLAFAYEIASVLGRKVTLPSLEYHTIPKTIEDNFELEVLTDNCTMYNAKMVSGIKVGPSPEFIKQRLQRAGMRSINNVVDISNYVMLEYGQPLHFFDYDKLGNKIVVRMAYENEEIVTLDDKKRMLSSDDIVITDGVEPVCIAGVMGGKNTEVDENTQTILIESAIFNPYNVRYTSLGLDLRSEASLRYEKGLNYEYTLDAIKRACHLLEKYASGKVLSGMITHDTIVKSPRKVNISLKQINSLLGMELTIDDVKKSLNNLEFNYEIDEETFEVTIPNRRLDVEENKADIIEEVGRLYGYDNIKAALPKLPTKTGKYIGNVKYRKLISNRLRSLGLNEAKTYTLISEEEDSLFNYDKKESIKLLRPMSSDKAIVRQTLIPSLLKAIDYNVNHNVKDILLYEIANVYYNEEIEETKIALALKGDYLSNKWNGQKITVDYYLIKGIVENLLDYLGLKNRYQFVKSEIKNIHPGICASILVDNEEIGFIGKIHPTLRKDDVYVGELSLNKLIDKKIKPIKYKELSKYPSSIKDLSFIVDKEITSDEIIKVIKKAGGRLLTNIEVFDVYVGNKVLDNQKSIAFSLTFNDSNRTLNEEEITTIFNKIINEVETKLNAKLRDK